MKKILGKCQCGSLVTKFFNDSNSPYTDGTNYKLTEDEQSKWSMFRCKECGSVISKSWKQL